MAKLVLGLNVKGLNAKSDVPKEQGLEASGICVLGLAGVSGEF